MGKLEIINFIKKTVRVYKTKLYWGNVWLESWGIDNVFWQATLSIIGSVCLVTWDIIINKEKLGIMHVMYNNSGCCILYAGESKRDHQRKNN